MARKTETIVIKEEGRDRGRVFLLTEMPAAQAEEWATRALLAMGRSGASIPDEILGSGMSGIAALTLRAFAGLRWEDARPLLAEMFECVKIIPDPARDFSRTLIEDDIEEVATRVYLRDRLMDLHTGFSIADGLSKFRQFLSAQVAGNTSDTATSPLPLDE